MNGSMRPPEVRGVSHPQKIRVLVVDDHELVRRGLRALFDVDSGCEICGEAANGRDAVECARQLEPDVVVLDISMPGLNGLEAARQIRKTVPKAEVLALTMSDSDQLVRQLLNAGVHGYLLKSDAATDLVEGVKSLGKHKPFFTSKVARMVLAGYLKVDKTGKAEDRNADSGALTPREQQIVQLLAEGKNNKEIAGILGIAVKTAETHRANIMRKLDLHSVSEIVRYAVRNQIIQP